MPHNPDSGKNILVINDDPAILQLLEDLLCDEGHRVKVDLFQRTADAMLDLIRSQQPDLAIIDFGLRTEVKGRQLVEAMHTDPATRDIPVVICTIPMKQPVLAGDYLNSPNIRVLIKPFDIDDVLHAIDTAGKSASPQAFNWDTTGLQMPGASYSA